MGLSTAPQGKNMDKGITGEVITWKIDNMAWNSPMNSLSQAPQSWAWFNNHSLTVK